MSLLRGLPPDGTLARTLDEDAKAMPHREMVERDSDGKLVLDWGFDVDAARP